jgi:hypothetical protein
MFILSNVYKSRSFDRICLFFKCYKKKYWIEQRNVQNSKIFNILSTELKPKDKYLIQSFSQLVD